MNGTGTKPVGRFTAPRRTNLTWQILTEQHSPIVKGLKIQKTQTFLAATERWMTFPEDKSIVRKYMIMRKQLRDLIYFVIHNISDLICLTLWKFINFKLTIEEKTNTKLQIFFNLLLKI